MQTGELIIIVLLALVVLGPQRLPELARKAGHWAAELRKAAREITAGLEAEVSEFKQLGDELRGPLDEAGRDISAAGRDISRAGKQGLEWKGPKPLSGPTPEDAMRDLERIEGRGEDGDVEQVGPAETAEPGEPAQPPDETPGTVDDTARLTVDDRGTQEETVEVDEEPTE